MQARSSSLVDKGLMPLRDFLRLEAAGGLLLVAVFFFLIGMELKREVVETPPSTPAPQIAVAASASR